MSSLSITRSAPPLLSSVVATYETDVTVHPRCLLEFRYPVSFAWQGLDLSLENESVALNYSFRGRKEKGRRKLSSSFFLRPCLSFSTRWCSHEFVGSPFKSRSDVAAACSIVFEVLYLFKYSWLSVVWGWLVLYLVCIEAWPLVLPRINGDIFLFSVVFSVTICSPTGR